MDYTHINRMFGTFSQNVIISAALVFAIAICLLVISRPQHGDKLSTMISKLKSSLQATDGQHDPFDLDKIVSYSGLPLYHPPDWPRYWKSGKYQLTMGLRKLDINNWLTFDDQWFIEHEAKKKYCKLPNKTDVVDYLDGEDTAVIELLDLVVAYLTRKFPDMFTLKGDYVTITPINERYRVKKPFDQPPMEIIGLLAMDDLYILKKGDRDLYYL